jgi:hypothetical protein
VSNDGDSGNEVEWKLSAFVLKRGNCDPVGRGKIHLEG